MNNTVPTEAAVPISRLRRAQLRIRLREQEADGVIKEHVIGALGVGLFPVPVLESPPGRSPTPAAGCSWGISNAAAIWWISRSLGRGRHCTLEEGKTAARDLKDKAENPDGAGG